jgi:hypothetical protein
VKRGIIPIETGTAGWLGKYESKLAQRFQGLQAEQERSKGTRGR